MTVAEELNQIDAKYSNIRKMPVDVRKRYNKLNNKLVGKVWDYRIKTRGSIHSHLDIGERNGS